MQELDGEKWLVFYLSCKLLTREMRYCTIEWGALTIKQAVDTLRYCLLGNPFHLVTDHASFWWFNNMKETNAQIM